MELSKEKRGDFTIVGISGKLDTTTAPQLNTELDQLSNQGESKIVIDCADLDYISSSGLRVLLVYLKKLKGAGGKLLLSNIKDSIKEIFVVSGFTSIFSIFNSVDEALAS